jgi:ribonucleoside-triphosphate reductase
MYQSCYADNAVSFTVNFPEGRYTVDEAAGIIRHYLPHLKGTTLMPDGTRQLAPYERISKADFELYQYTMVGDGVDEDCANGACPVK